MSPTEAIEWLKAIQSDYVAGDEQYVAAQTAMELLERETLVQEVVQQYRAYVAACLVGREDPSAAEEKLFEVLPRLAAWLDSQKLPQSG